MPWEIDYMGFTFLNLKESLVALKRLGGKASPPVDNVEFTIDSVLNLSSHSIDWKKSKLPKEYFIEKYNAHSLLLKTPHTLQTNKEYNGLMCFHNKKIYKGDKLYGHLDLQKSCIGEKFDYYFHICPDIWFDKYSFLATIQGAVAQKQRDPDGHFIMTPSTFKMWDKSWDEVVHTRYKNVHYNDWWKIDICEFKFLSDISNGGRQFNFNFNVVKKRMKWAGWFDLYSKEIYENVIQVPKDWTGYGPWDLFSMFTLSHLHNNYSLNFKQIVTDQAVSKYSTGGLDVDSKPANTGNWLQHPIKKFLHFKKGKTKDDQRLEFFSWQKGKAQMDPVRTWVKQRREDIVNDKNLFKKLKLKEKNYNPPPEDSFHN